ncbi:MAG TPA: enoyl-CoA hydratase [Burkholderiaceae bacterium]|nr:enoyl-CoA hydratase [Burkholderiaceae bacterium]
MTTTRSLAEFRHAAAEIDARGIATLTLREAGSHNVLSTPVMLDLLQAMQVLDQCEDLRVLVLRGSGDKAFVAGADIREMRELNEASARVFIDRLRQVCESMRTLPVPVIARIPGWALGGGLELAAACDLRVASNRAQFGMPEIKVGIPSIIHAALLPRLLGTARARWLLLVGDNIDAAQALDWGLVDAVVPQERLDDEVQRLAAQLAGYGPQALRQQKRLLCEWERQPLDEAILQGVDEFAAAYRTGEPQRSMAPFGRKAG